MCAFGGLADKFLPFESSQGGKFEIHLASVVMKAVQARHSKITSTMQSAGKLGDDMQHAKIQVGNPTTEKMLDCFMPIDHPMLG